MTIDFHSTDNLPTIGPVCKLNKVCVDETMVALLAADGYDATVEVQLVKLPLKFVVAELEPCLPEDYLFDDEEDEDEAQQAYRLVLEIADVYSSDPTAVDPIVIGRSVYNVKQTTMYDGYHRCCSAVHGQAQYVLAYLIVSQPKGIS